VTIHHDFPAEWPDPGQKWTEARISDNQGHAAGDALLRRAGQVRAIPFASAWRTSSAHLSPMSSMKRREGHCLKQGLVLRSMLTGSL